MNLGHKPPYEMASLRTLNVTQWRFSSKPSNVTLYVKDIGSPYNLFSLLSINL